MCLVKLPLCLSRTIMGSLSRASEAEANEHPNENVYLAPMHQVRTSGGRACRAAWFPRSRAR